MWILTEKLAYGLLVSLQRYPLLTSFGSPLRSGEATPILKDGTDLERYFFSRTSPKRDPGGGSPRSGASGATFPTLATQSLGAFGWLDHSNAYYSLNSSFTFGFFGGAPRPPRATAALFL